jgi:large subunit ribosomal protein L25
MIGMELAVEHRTLLGKKVKLLRKEGKVPGVIYGKHLPAPLHIVVDKMPFIKAYNQAWMNTALELKGKNVEELVLIHDVKCNPVNGMVQHIDFLAVQKNQKVTAEIPVELVWEPPIEKLGLGSVQQLLMSIEVEAFPMDLPHNIEIDVSHLDHAWMVIHVSDITLPKAVACVTESDAAIVTVVAFDTAWDDAQDVQESPAQ